MKRPLTVDGKWVHDADGVCIGNFRDRGVAAMIVAAYNLYPELFGALDELIRRAEAVDKGLTDYDLVIIAGERALLRKATQEGKKFQI